MQSQNQLMDTVYSPGGTMQLLAKLHNMVYPPAAPESRAGSVVDGQSGRGGGTGGSSNGKQPTAGTLTRLNLGLTGNTQAAAGGSAATVASPPYVPLDEAPKLLGLLVDKLGVELPLLVRIGILQVRMSHCSSVTWQVKCHMNTSIQTAIRMKDLPDLCSTDENSELALCSMNAAGAHQHFLTVVACTLAAAHLWQPCFVFIL